MKGLLIGILTFISGFIISLVSTVLASGGNGTELFGMAIMTAILFLSAVIATCTSLILKAGVNTRN